MYQLNLVRTHDLLDGLLEVTAQDPDTTQAAWLSPEYKEILSNQVNIRKEYKIRAKLLEQYTALIIELAIDWSRLHAYDFKPHIPTLQAMLSGKGAGGVGGRALTMADLSNLILTRQRARE